MTESVQGEAQPQFMPMLNSDLARVLLLGAFVGIATYGVALLLGNFVFHPILCQGAAERCVAAASYGDITAAVLMAVLGLLGLVRFRTFRPMVVVVAATASLWGLTAMLGDVAWYWNALAHFVLYALAYGLFVWTVRIRAFWLALLASVVLVVLVRLAMTS